jgi:hypothetical protein
MNTTQTDNGKKQETVKEILDRHAPKWIGEDCVPRDQALAAMKEIADKALEASVDTAIAKFEEAKRNATKLQDLVFLDVVLAVLEGLKSGSNRSTFMKSLFPEDSKDTSASG